MQVSDAMQRMTGALGASVMVIGLSVPAIAGMVCTSPFPSPEFELVYIVSKQSGLFEHKSAETVLVSVPLICAASSDPNSPTAQEFTICHAGEGTHTYAFRMLDDRRLIMARSSGPDPSIDIMGPFRCRHS